MSRAIKTIHLFEDALLVLLLTSMIVLATSQIFMRNFFDSGLVWVDPLLRVMVLWLGLVGATIASRNNKHIRIDLLTRFFSKNVNLATQTIVGLFTAIVSGLIAWHGARWVLMDYQDGIKAFSGLPSWVLEIIIPVAFGLISIRYFLYALHSLSCFFKDRPHCEDSDS